MKRRLCAAILSLQSIVVGLSAAVMASVEDVDNAVALGLGLGLALGCLLVAGLLRFEWAYGLGWALQAGTIALGFLATAMFVLGAIFAVLWLSAVRLGRMVDETRAAYQAAEAGAPPAH